MSQAAAASMNMPQKWTPAQKLFPHQVGNTCPPHDWDAAPSDFLSHFTHAFLIRDPALTITSMYAKWPDFDAAEVGFPEQRALYDLLTALNGTPPTVVDSGDLLEAPALTVKAFCEAVDIPFIEDALSWEPGADTGQYSWWDGGSFHANLKNSTGLRPQKRKYVEIAEAPDRVQHVYRHMKPHYDRLYANRTRPQ
ncbi:hypothetical protein IWQ54_006228 [Labrenzia sp. EL_195]|nr:hypothetical protein [Labrenzia sp. EL_195]